MLAAAAGGHPEAVTAFLLGSVPPNSLQALLRSWHAAEAGLQRDAAAGGDAVEDTVAPNQSMDDELLFYVSTEGDAAAAGAAPAPGDEGEDSASDSGALDLAQLPGDEDGRNGEPDDDQSSDSA